MTAKNLNLSIDQNQLQSWAHRNQDTTRFAPATPPPQPSLHPSSAPSPQLRQFDDYDPRPSPRPSNKPSPQLATQPNAFERPEPRGLDTRPTPIHSQAAASYADTAQHVQEPEKSRKARPKSRKTLFTKSRAKKAKQKKHRNQSGSNTLYALLATCNMLFLILAGYWLTGLEKSGFTHPGVSNSAAAMAGNESTLSAIQGEVSESAERLAALEQQVTALTVMLENRSAPSIENVATTANSGSEASQKAAPTQVAYSRESAANTTKIAATPQVKPAWQVYLGDFDTRKQASDARRRVLQLGLPASLHRTTPNGETLYQVQLDGFEQRQEAEKAADRIMQETDLNGLWVARAD